MASEKAVKANADAMRRQAGEMIRQPYAIRMEVPPQRIADMFVGAIEGESSYWCSDFTLLEPNRGGYESPWYSDPKFWEGDSWRVEARWEDGKMQKKVITRLSLEKGLELFASKYQRHFADMMNETDDATTADVFFQCVVLGDVVFG